MTPACPGCSCSSSRAPTSLLASTTATTSSASSFPAPKIAKPKPNRNNLSLFGTISKGYTLRCAANPSFPLRSTLEVILAVTLQLLAEFNRRGHSLRNMWIAGDFILAGVVTAVGGKYYSMWKVAPTHITPPSSSSSINPNSSNSNSSNSNGNGKGQSKSKIPTNAFLAPPRTPFLYRFSSFISPVPSLFTVGFITAFLGYSATHLLTVLRSHLLPSYIPPTVPINVIHASVYTGCFLATVSNVRYQLLQGLIEPFIEYIFGGRESSLTKGVVFLVRCGNGFLGSWIAITGMRLFGLQKMK